MTKFQESESDDACESCEPTETAIKFTREREQERKRIICIYLFYFYIEL